MTTPEKGVEKVREEIEEQSTEDKKEPSFTDDDPRKDIYAKSDAIRFGDKPGQEDEEHNILDIMMLGIDGIEVSRRLRQAGDVPILMLTAKGTVADRVAGLDSGADDYLVKPFDFDELLARVRALLRRRQPREQEPLRFSDLSLNTVTREVKRGSELIELTAQEFNLLEFFIRHPRQVLTRDMIYERVWGYNFDNESNVIEVYIRYLRSKLEAGGQSRLIYTVHGVGYVMKE